MGFGRAGVIALVALVASCSSFGSEDQNSSGGPAPEAGSLPPADGGADGATPCRGDACLTVLASGEEGAAEVVAEGADVYWTIATAGSGAIRGCAVASCAPRTLAANQDLPRSLVVDASRVSWASGIEIRRVMRDGSDVPGPYLRSDGSEVVRAFRRAGNYVVFSSGNGFTRCDAKPAKCEFSSTLTPATDSQAGPVTLDPASPEIVWGASKTKIYKVHPLQDVKMGWSLPNIRALVANETTLFAITEDSANVFAIATNAPVTDTPAVIATASQPYAFALHGGHLYVADIKGGIVRIPAIANGGSPSVLATELAGPKSIAVTQDRIILVLGDGRIVSIPRPA
jgi:hypothetical protein